MEDVKVQLTTENVDYKNRMNLSFAKLLNSLIEISRTNKEVESLLLTHIQNKGKHHVEKK